ncbi:PREDICTED: uncharacterized protein LOC106746096 isoform X2 [Dinoponera quadriceps]|nr:PREDICTED: uncharacterized protein LOC106746096 isoform X2 [Dinoponera quadriceps]
MAHQLDNIYLLILLPSIIAHLCWCAHGNYQECKFPPNRDRKKKSREIFRVLLVASLKLLSLSLSLSISDVLESDKICHPLNRSHLHDIRNASAVIINSKYFFNRWVVNLDRYCKYTFRTAKGEGLFAVIHNMFFRRKNNGACLDYVRFKRSDGHQTSEFCGEVQLNSLTYSEFPVSLHDHIYSEFEPIHGRSSSGKLETEIFISKEEVPKGQTLDLKIVYTPYRECGTVDANEFRPVRYNSCIRKEYICDRIHNCWDTVCNDEVDCPPNTDVLSREDSTTEVTVGAVTTVILCFIIFVMCLWICKRSQKLCWSSDCAGPNVCSRPGSLPSDADGSASRAVPSAPMLEVAVSSPVADKDLPPSYDSLFPEQSNPARS